MSRRPSPRTSRTRSRTRRTCTYGDPIEKHWDEEEGREISTKRDLYPGPELEEEESDAEEEEEEDGGSGGE